MSNTNPLVAQLIKLLPFLGRNVCYSDRELAMKRFRRMLAEQPNAFLDAYDAAIAEIRKIYPHESADLIDSAALSELESGGRRNEKRRHNDRRLCSGLFCLRIGKSVARE